MDWEEITMDYIQYMERAILRLWEEENPNFPVR